MAEPPSTPPSSDIAGVHRDGTRPGKKLPTAEDEDAGELEEAARGDAARPDYDGAVSRDDRTG
jgi:hypothetical protein